MLQNWPHTSRAPFWWAEGGAGEEGGLKGSCGWPSTVSCSGGSSVCAGKPPCATCWASSSQPCCVPVSLWEPGNACGGCFPGGQVPSRLPESQGAQRRMVAAIHSRHPELGRPHRRTSLPSLTEHSPTGQRPTAHQGTHAERWGSA